MQFLLSMHFLVGVVITAANCVIATSQPEPKDK